MTKRDVIVVGGGHNGLVCAAYLARAGCRVLLFEASAEFGGGARQREFAPGYQAPISAHIVPPPTRALLRDLKLAEHGWSGAAADVNSVALATDGAHLALDEPFASPQFSDDDADGWRRFRADTDVLAGFLARQLQRPPLSLYPTSWRDAWPLLRAGAGLARLGRSRMREFLRVVGLSMFDYTAEYIADPLLRGALCAEAVMGSGVGPRAPGTAFNYLHRRAMLGKHGRWLAPAGGAEMLTAALAASARAFGAELTSNAGVSRVLVEYGKATGVQLADGSVVRALTVVSAIDPVITLLKLVGPRALEAGFTREVQNVRGRGGACRVHLAVNAVPRFTGLDLPPRARLIVAPDAAYVEHAADAIKYVESSAEPVLEVTLPSVENPALAPAGHAVISITAQFTPFIDDTAAAAEQRAKMLQHVVSALARYAPDLPDSIVAAECLTPADLAREFGSAGGHWHHAELALDQFFFTRPVSAAPAYRLPVDGLFLASAGTHPGGNLTGWPGRLAAQTVLAQ